MAAFAGFDFGTANCALGTIHANKPQVVALPDHGNYMLSSLWAPNPEMICGWLYRQLKPRGLDRAYALARSTALTASLRAGSEAKLDGYGDEVAFGHHGLELYLEDPADCYYVRSPKSFLGSSGVTTRQQQMFEDISAAMMWQMRSQAEQAGIDNLEKVVIGRPVNFQGFNSEDSNRQALDVLSRAASYVGFKEVEFLYEPVAAGLSYEMQLERPQRVMVVDIGGGTSDVSMLEMGPKLAQQSDQQRRILGFNGERIGGNDFDITLNVRTLMPTLGAGLVDSNGRTIPLKPFFDAAEVNSIGAQTRFYGKDMLKFLQELQQKPELATVSRLIKVQQQHMTFQLSALAEQAKIALSEQPQTQVDLGCIEANLTADVTQSQFTQASQNLLNRIAYLCDDVMAQAGCEPDTLYLTGGSANAPFIKAFLADRYQKPMVSGDNFGSVTSGLTLWASRIFS
ncbi:molecular chaperone [Ferrimonas aestuarii]|nr:molecular chaperone [Ferrimonas aestuarii]